MHRREFIRNVSLAAGAAMLPATASAAKSIRVTRVEDEFYATSGGIFLPSAHYEGLFHDPVRGG